jgi:hypothetical protein
VDIFASVILYRQGYGADQGQSPQLRKGDLRAAVNRAGNDRFRSNRKASRHRHRRLERPDLNMLRLTSFGRVIGRLLGVTRRNGDVRMRAKMSRQCSTLSSSFKWRPPTSPPIPIEEKRDNFTCCVSKDQPSQRQSCHKNTALHAVFSNR